jgi:hypothetical protein
VTSGRTATSGRFAGAILAGILSLVACTPLLPAVGKRPTPAKTPVPVHKTVAPKPTAKPSAKPTPKPTPKASPKPTATPAPPSPTPAPTASGTPIVTPTATPSGTPSDPPANTLQLGFSAGELVGMSSPDIATVLDRYQAAGGSVIRFDLNWARVQPTGSGSWDWSSSDRIISALNARHLTALPILDYTPAWARPAGCSSEQCGPADPAAFASFAAAAVARYSGQGVKVWEIWNEENTGWLPSPSVSAYGQLLQQTSAAIHGIDSQAQVIVGGLAPAGTNSAGSYSPPDFVSDLYGLGLRSSIDGVAVHPYSFPALPADAQAWSGWSQMVAVHAVMASNGDGAKGIWATEFGAPTSGPGAMATYANRQYSSHPDHVDLDLQARTVDAGIAAARQLPWLRMLLWYSVMDLGTSSSSNVFSFGLLNPNGSPKPSYARWQAAVRSVTS